MASLTASMGNIGIRPLEPEDKDQLAKLANNKKIWDNVRDFFPNPYTLKDAVDFITISNQEKPVRNFAITYKDELAGITGLILQTDIYRISAELGYWIGEPYWNMGIASAAVKLLLKYAFENLKLERIYSGVFESNKASQRVLEKCGFTLETIFKNAILKNDTVINEYRYAILKSEFSISHY